MEEVWDERESISGVRRKDGVDVDIEGVFHVVMYVDLSGCPRHSYVILSSVHLTIVRNELM